MQQYIEMIPSSNQVLDVRVQIKLEQESNILCGEREEKMFSISFQ